MPLSLKESLQSLSRPSFLGGLSSPQFLEHHWQKKHLFVAKGFPELVNCITPEELAGFSLEEDIESRIIIERDNNQWELQHGPFTDELFQSLPQSHWTLLVQAIDHYVPNFASLLDQFNFIPQWRIDDIMMSYAATGGNVGPHYDYYDVFLIQISGKRNWKIGQACDENTAILDGLPVRILKDFETSDEWVVEPGDVLYLPPGLAHHGVALDDDCITLSVGFRAPSYADMINEYSHHLAQQLPGNLRYADQDLTARLDSRHHSGMLSEQDIKRVQQQLLNHFQNPDNIKAWLAEYLSLPKYEHSTPVNYDANNNDILEQLKLSDVIQRDEACRFILDSNGNNPNFYINGEQYSYPENALSLVNLIAAQRQLASSEIQAKLIDNDVENWFCTLVKQGLLYFPNDCD